MKKQADCEDERSKFVLNGRQLILRDVVEKIVACFDRVKQIGDVLCHYVGGFVPGSDHALWLL